MTELPADMKAQNRKVIEEYRANKGAGGRPLLLLTTTGVRTGEPRTTPMMYVPDGDRLLVIASNAGAPKHPDWYRNLVADPAVTVEVDAERFETTAEVPERRGAGQVVRRDRGEVPVLRRSPGRHHPDDPGRGPGPPR
jgi:deazaflavin-dependent oxidoreductase (nitroreductase family)